MHVCWQRKENKRAVALFSFHRGFLVLHVSISFNDDLPFYDEHGVRQVRSLQASMLLTWEQSWKVCLIICKFWLNLLELFVGVLRIHNLFQTVPGNHLTSRLSECELPGSEGPKAAACYNIEKSCLFLKMTNSKDLSWKMSPCGLKL